jgi:hypothetical protein
LVLVLVLVLCLTLSGCGLYQTKKTYLPYKAVAITGYPS